jgi:hypothetical protein
MFVSSRSILGSSFDILCRLFYPLQCLFTNAFNFLYLPSWIVCFFMWIFCLAPYSLGTYTCIALWGIWQMNWYAVWKELCNIKCDCTVIVIIADEAIYMPHLAPEYFISHIKNDAQLSYAVKAVQEPKRRLKETSYDDSNVLKHVGRSTTNYSKCSGCIRW